MQRRTELLAQMWLRQPWLAPRQLGDDLITRGSDCSPHVAEREVRRNGGRRCCVLDCLGGLHLDAEEIDYRIRLQARCCCRSAYALDDTRFLRRIFDRQMRAALHGAD